MGRFSSTMLLALTLGAGLAQADILYDTGNVTFAPTGTQYGRLYRDGVSSDWSTQKTFPGVSGAPTQRAYETITLNTGFYSYLQIDFDDKTTSFFASAYLDSYNPVNAAPNYGLDVNYLGDPGVSGNPFGNPGFFQVFAPNSTVVFVITEVSPGGGTGKSFDLMVEGFLDTDYTGVPEPASIVLLVSAAGIAAAWKKRRAA